MNVHVPCQACQAASGKQTRLVGFGLLCFRENKLTHHDIQASASRLSSAVADGFDLGDVRYRSLTARLNQHTFQFSKNRPRYSTQLATSSELSDMEQKSIWSIFEQNMRHLYDLFTRVVYALRQTNECVGRYAKSSMGWDPPSKKQELFHCDSRFVIIRRAQAQDDPDSLCVEIPIVAYSMFRFDMEDDECVLYWYFLAPPVADPPGNTHFYCPAMSYRSRNRCSGVAWGRL